jgi:predicted DNA-binding WGR domain protein
MTIGTTKRETVLKPETFDGYYELTEGTSNKFWAYCWDGNESIDIYWGRIDKDTCRTHTKTFEYHIEAIRWLKDKISEKLDKGYA